MTDRSQTQITAISEMFAYTLIVLCRIHIMRQVD
jgi:hypothetical protein